MPKLNINNANNDVKFKIFTSEFKEKIIKQLNNLKKSHKIIDISMSTNTKYSKIFDREYTEYNIFVQYI